MFITPLDYTYGGKNMSTQEMRWEMDADRFEDFVHSLEAKREMEWD